MASKPQKECDLFNARIPVGSLVEYSEILGDLPIGQFRTRTEAQVLSGHTAVVWLEGKSGCVCVEHCTLVEVDKYFRKDEATE